ncbi:17 kDa surface antigen [Candidatus Propionivibrio aalborgensis]|uniref:17 kDa surface antigen n=1 Tax=Candidatus Propionivibrio aalborgensis TaxID=1860101 RepID=A0A1A8XWZ5_9RHOO|nr:glycine zipper 2TM domain-containing protein [Candidatus Propionivibrio aalborgensis]MBK7565521.1 glycine zipper 2TM domain-containing protein [Propionivibrio sp.]MBK9028873.1 glycine zipper 2TM domain-containing protein [Propionivibrio sp.]SBT08543.1 17 kDa surface antigen [Candidatus Propionivibrio aalborgensis]
MFNKFASYLSALALAVMLTACATPGQQPGEMDIRTGIIEQINPVQLQSSHHAGVGAVVGGIAGLGLGSLIGAGTGRDVAMVLGTVGGAFAGNEIQKKYDQPVPGQQIIVRTTNGVLISVTQATNPNLFKGQRVYVEGNGDGARVVPR